MRKSLSAPAKTAGRDSGCSMLPTTPSTPLGREAMRSAERVITRTSTPRANNSLTAWLPIVPVPPITTVFDINDLLCFLRTTGYNSPHSKAKSYYEGAFSAGGVVQREKEGALIQ